MKKERNIFMTKLWDTLKNRVKTIHELAKELPEKTYRQLEKYRDADRREEAQQIFTQQENEELKEDQLTKVDLDYKKSLDQAAQDSKLAWEKEHKLRQEAETETILIKGIGMNSPEMKNALAKCDYLQKELDRVKKENNKLYNRIADLTDADSNLEKARESGL